MSTPILQATRDTQPYWDFASKGGFAWQKCSACGSLQNVPRSICAECRSNQIDWVEVEPRGKIVSISRVHRAPNKQFSSQTPYTIVLVELDAGFRLMFNLVGGGTETAIIGDRVEIFSSPEGDGVGGFPQARRA